MKYAAMIQARCGSSRMPNKVLKEISGKPELQWVIERVRRSRLMDEVIVVTSIEKDNLPLIKLCAELGVRVFAGSEEDVLDRYYQAAKLLKPEYVVRITADCPLFDWRYRGETDGNGYRLYGGNDGELSRRGRHRDCKVFCTPEKLEGSEPCFRERARHHVHQESSRTVPNTESGMSDQGNRRQKMDTG